MIDKLKEELLLKCLQGNADEKEYETAYHWIHSDKSNYEYYESLRDAWVAAGIVKQKSEYDCYKAWKRVARRTGTRFVNALQVRTIWLRVAAVLVLAFISGAISYHLLYDFLQFSWHFTKSEFVVEAPLGAKSRIVLSDSTSVWLNAGSTLRYSTGYDIKERDVHLTGEGYFEVASNEKLPFRVHASNLVINALGTEFNVKAYPEEGTVETTLVSGMVRLEHKAAEGQVERLLLRPNQRASYTITDNIIDITRVADEENEVREMIQEIAKEVLPRKIKIEPVFNTELYTSWKDKRLLFESERMFELAVKLERIYDVRIIFQDDDLKDYRLTGSLEQETLEQLLYAMRLTIPMDFSIKNNNVFLTINHRLKEEYKKHSTKN